MALDLLSDMSERLRYILPGFPLYVRRPELRMFDSYSVACHWHPDLEFICVQEGATDYNVNGTTSHLEKGQGIFVNSKRLHYNYSSDFSNCEYYVVVIHPRLLCGDTHAGAAFFESKFGFDTEDYILLDPETGWQREALGLIQSVYERMYTAQPDLLVLLARAASISALIGENIQPAVPGRADKQTWLTVWNMTGFIQKNYMKKINLDDIAAAGSVCRSRCCKLLMSILRIRLPLT